MPLRFQFHIPENKIRHTFPRIIENSFLYGNQFFERILLLFTEQRAYPPNHYIRRVPQRVVHTFTALQFVQLLVLAIVGFYPFAYLKIIFPVLIMALLPVRQFLLPKVINQKYLDALDGHHD